jgi:hypothetical protein
MQTTEMTKKVRRRADGPLSTELLEKMDAYWRAASYLSVGQIYLYDNPLLKDPLKLEHVKPRLVGHWGTTPGLNFIYFHLNRVIKEHDLNMLYVTGARHGGPGLVANTFLEGCVWAQNAEYLDDCSQPVVRAGWPFLEKSGGCRIAPAATSRRSNSRHNHFNSFSDARMPPSRVSTLTAHSSPPSLRSAWSPPGASWRR